jgi:hypothetical protein
MDVAEPLPLLLSRNRTETNFRAVISNGHTGLFSSKVLEPRPSALYERTTGTAFYRPYNSFLPVLMLPIRLADFGFRRGGL